MVAAAAPADDSTLVVALGSVSVSEDALKASSLQQAATESLKNGETYSRLEIHVQASELTKVYQPLELSQWARLWQKNNDATVSVHVHMNSESQQFQPIHTSFLLAGLQSTSERKQQNVRILTAQPKQKSNNNTVSIDLIDENALLDDGLLAPPPNTSQAAALSKDDCGGRMPCDNCTCGRKEELQSSSSSNKPKSVPSSSCGKCGMGDAFRCASCPYLGKPAFKAGEEHLVLDLQDDL